MLAMGMRHAPPRAALAMVLRYAAERYEALKSCVGIGAATGLHAIVLNNELVPFYGSLGEQAIKQKALVPGVKSVDLSVAVLGNAIVHMDREQAAFSIDWLKRSCTCGVPQTLGVPCVHVFAMADRPAAPQHAIAQFTAPGVMRAHLLSAMHHKIKQVAIDMSTLRRDALRKGPILLADGTAQSTTKKRGRPSAEKRIPSTGEDAKRKRPATAAAAAASTSSAAAASSTSSAATTTAQLEKKKKPQVCGKCKQPGHNAARCGKQ